MGLAGFDADGLEKNGCRDMVRVGNERDGHPVADGLIRRVDAARLAAGAIGEDESACQRQREGDTNGEGALPGFSHDSI